jgi:hypothetical protein
MDRVSLVAATDVGPPEIATLILAAVIWAELIGVSVAWLRLRRRAEWADRPAGTRRIDLLSRYVGGLTALAGLFSAVVVLVGWVAAAVS